MVSLGGGASIQGWDLAPLVSPVVGEEVKREWLTQRELGAWGLQTTERAPTFTPLTQDYTELAAEEQNTDTLIFSSYMHGTFHLI